MTNPQDNTTVLDVQNVSKVFHVPTPGFERVYIAAVDEVSLALHEQPARIVSLVGESGSGKTTLARIMLGLTPPTHGEVLYRGKQVAELSKTEWWDFRRNVQPIFQDPFGIYNPFYRVDRALDMTIKNFNLAASKDEAYWLKAEALRAVDLRPEDVIGRYPHQLSGGQCQRVMLARTLLLRPKIIIADEPVSMIDVAVRMLFLNTLLDFRDKYNISALMITHDLATAYYMGGPMLVLCFGRVVESGDIDQLLNNPSHPYTQQLLAAIPSPDPTKRWAERANVKITDRPLTHEGNKCVYVQRCPHAMPVCSMKRPPQFVIEEGHYATCFLHQDHHPVREVVPQKS
ncbi:MAG TPA: ABC transporter ATP-binding protein [Anaerolineae bacterium]|nr:ABC transporter ATP-binding protein [Anaerolineae bacterium]HQI84304.1 ABC transporter ATP-binding protein [Anaerolineae bacterium]